MAEYLTAKNRLNYENFCRVAATAKTGKNEKNYKQFSASHSVDKVSFARWRQADNDNHNRFARAKFCPICRQQKNQSATNKPEKEKLLFSISIIPFVIIT